jgi:hypothetical protein
MRRAERWTLLARAGTNEFHDIQIAHVVQFAKVTNTSPGGSVT